MGTKVFWSLILLSWLLIAAIAAPAFAEDSPRPLSAPNGETVRELKSVTHGKTAPKNKAEKPRRAPKRPRFNPEDVGC